MHSSSLSSGGSVPIPHEYAEPSSTQRDGAMQMTEEKAVSRDERWRHPAVLGDTGLALFSDVRRAEKEVERIMLGECPMASSADLVLERLDHLVQTDLVLWLQMTVVMGGMLWCLALALTLFVGGWYASTHPSSGTDRTIRRLARVLSLLTLGLTEYPPPTAEDGETRGDVPMDKQEAERLAQAIERMHVAWLQVDQIVFNETRKAYELKCSYRGPAGFLGSKAIWRTRWITSPREWIGLLTEHRGTL